VADEPEQTGERFYLGTIHRMFPSAGLGVVRSDAGRDIPFAAAHVLIRGAAQRFEELREGMRVGFDVGWTARGLRVTLLQVRSAEDQPPRPDPTGS
jgi:cold shock CspA family protein